LGASLVVPAPLALLTDGAWIAGLVLAGVAAMAIAAGLLGLYPGTCRRSPRLSAIGAIAASVGGVGGSGVLALGTAAGVTGALGIDPGTPITTFAVVALATGIGLSAGMAAFGAALSSTDTGAGWTPALLAVGATALAVPVTGGLLQFGGGITTPSWPVFPAIVTVSLVTLAVGRMRPVTDRRTRSDDQ